MARSDRLYALVEELRARPPGTVVQRHDLARRLEVSARTIERDILTLQQAGVPIWTQRGAHGGYAIEHSTTLPPLNLEATEALAVMAALSVLPNHPFAAAGRRAQHKLLAAMREADVDKAQELAARIRTERPGADGRRPDNEVMRSIEQAVVARKVVDLDYADRKGAASTRTVEAHGLHLTSRTGYLIGWCRLRDAGRAFRLDRIERATVLDEVAPERDLDPMLDWVDGAATLDPAGGARPAPAGATTTQHGPPAWLLRDQPPPDAASLEPAAALVRPIVGDLPDVDEHDHHGRPAWRHGDATFAAVQDDRRLWLEATHAEVVARTTTSPDVYERHFGLTVRLDRVDHQELRRLVVAAYRVARLQADQGVAWSDVTALDPTAERTEDGRLVLRTTTPDVAAALALADPLMFRRATAGAAVLVDLDVIDLPRLRRLLVQLPQGAPEPC